MRESARRAGTRAIYCDEIAEYLRRRVREFSRTCGIVGLISPQNRLRAYRRIRQQNYFSLLEHENELKLHTMKLYRQLQPDEVKLFSSECNGIEMGMSGKN